MARGYVRMSDHDFSGAGTDFQRARTVAHKQGNIYYEMESRLALAELHVEQKKKSPQQELDRLRHDADKIGYGIFSIEIDTFLQSKSSPNRQNIR
jgi:hypothetical protein